MTKARLFLLTCFFLTVNCCVASSGDEDRPYEHFCPITLAVMKDPVVATDGHSYERAVISKHFDVNGTRSPLTNLPLGSRDLFDNHALRRMIEEWKPGKQERTTELDARDPQNIAQRVQEEFARNAILLRPEHSSKDRHIVAFLGNTGAGKSTLVNFLAGKELVVGPDGEDYVLAHPEDETAMAIGRGGNSETLYPKSIDAGDLRFFDLPGFNDTDGSERNLVNAAFIRKILLEAASVRLVFVAGHDQFTADRSASVRQMFNAVRQLFVVDGEQDQLVDEGVFVATKIIGKTQDSIIDFLLRRTETRGKEELNRQLQRWHESHKLCLMFHATRHGENMGSRESILEAIRSIRPARIRGTNVSVLYPLETNRSLERMFCTIMERVLDRKMAIPLTTLSEYDREISLYTAGNFWEIFDGDVCTEEAAIGFLKEFCINPYSKALRDREGRNTKREVHIQVLRDKRQGRVQDIERRTDLRAREVIASRVPSRLAVGDRGSSAGSSAAEVVPFYKTVFCPKVRYNFPG